MRNLSKSRLLAYRQCAKRLWLEVHHPELREDSAATEAVFQVGHQVGEIAQRLYDPKCKGIVIDRDEEGYAAAIARTTTLLASSQPIFEAGFAAGGAMAFADVMLPKTKKGKRVWHMVEVKSSTKVKPYYHDDTAVQAFIVRTCGAPVASIALAHIDSTWVYPGGEDYQGLLTESDLTEEAFGRTEEVRGWISDAQAIARKRNEPSVTTGRHCGDPVDCGFLNYCLSQEPQTKYPVAWLPKMQTNALLELVEDGSVVDMRKVPDELLNERQLRVKTHTISGKTYFDGVGAAADLAPHKLPAYFLDFETIYFPIPIWKGTRPYQKIPFQFSLHRLSRTGKVEHQTFLDLSGNDPSRACADALIAACDEKGPIFAYHASFEKTCIGELAKRFPGLRRSLLAINERVVDLERVATQRYYHPDQQGSWSLKSVLPAVVPDLCYDDLNGVQNGGMAMDAFREAISPMTTPARKAEINAQLLDYCRLDTYATVRLWQFFTGRNDLKL